MKKGVARIIVGTVLILLQIMSFIGNAHAGIGIQISFDSIAVFAYDLVVLISYCFLGIVGVILLVSGIIARSKGKPEDCPPKEEVSMEKNVEEDTVAFHLREIPLSKSLPILFAISVLLLILIFILEKL